MRSVPLWLLILLTGALSSQSLAKPLKTTTGFWSHWGDGKAEVSVYELTTERYGERREGYAVSIVVTEPWNVVKSVKSDRSKGPEVIPALKLNLIRHFQTGVYDYHTMTSAFMALGTHPRVAQHGALKLTFSAQEWCGQAFQVVQFNPNQTSSEYHSYFETRPGGSQVMAPNTNEDFLWLLARGFTDAKTPTTLLRSLYDTRIHHQPLDAFSVSTHLVDRTLTIDTPRGPYTFTRGTTPNAPLQAWSTPWNERATLLTTKRIPYWQLNSAGGVTKLLDLGLKSASSRLKRSR